MNKITYDFNKLLVHKKQDIKLFKDTIKEEIQKNDRRRKREEEKEIIKEEKIKTKKERDKLKKRKKK